MKLVETKEKEPAKPGISINSNNSVGEFISLLFTARTQAHILHLNTKSFATHKALDTFYNDIVDLTDGLAEAYQGKYGIITGYIESEYSESISPIEYLKTIREYVLTNRYNAFKESDTNLQNEIDSIITLLDSTLYKLENLS